MTAKLLTLFGMMYWILAKFRINVPLNNFHKLFGFHAQYVNNRLVNLMLLSSRFLVYRCRYSITTFNMLQYFYAIKSIKNQNTILLRNITNCNLFIRNGLVKFRHCIYAYFLFSFLCSCLCAYIKKNEAVKV